MIRVVYIAARGSDFCPILTFSTFMAVFTDIDLSFIRLYVHTVCPGIIILVK